MFEYRYAKEWMNIPFLQLSKYIMVLPSKEVKKIMPEKDCEKVPICERYTLSVSEAAQYFGIGQVRLRSLIHANPNADYLIMVGNRCQIKRKKFEEYIDTATVI